MAHSNIYVFLLFSFPLTLLCMDPFEAVRSDKLALLQDLLVDTKDIKEFRDPKKNTLLHCACSAPVVRYLLSRAADVNALNSNNDTPLHTILWNGSHHDPSMAIELLDHGADMTLINTNHKTPVYHAVAKSSSFLLRFLSRVPRCELSEVLRKQQAKRAYSLLLCFKSFMSVQLPRMPKDICHMLVKYCKLPPYVLYDEHAAVHSLLFGKLDTLCKVLTVEDTFKQSPEDIELRIMPDERAQILDPVRVKKFSQLIIASIQEMINLKLSYTFEGAQLTIPGVLSAEPLPLYQDQE